MQIIPCAVILAAVVLVAVLDSPLPMPGSVGELLNVPESGISEGGERWVLVGVSYLTLQAVGDASQDSPAGASWSRGYEGELHSAALSVAGDNGFKEGPPLLDTVVYFITRKGTE